MSSISIGISARGENAAELRVGTLVASIEIGRRINQIAVIGPWNEFQFTLDISNEEITNSIVVDIAGCLNVPTPTVACIHQCGRVCGITTGTTMENPQFIDQNFAHCKIIIPVTIDIAKSTQ